MKYQYPFERFHYETADDYIVTALRISGGKGASPLDIQKSKRPVVVFWHGFFDSADAAIC